MLETLSISEFLLKIAAREPVPGGGSVSAMAAAAAAALSEMVANLTIGRKGHEEDEPEMKILAGRAAELRQKLVKAITLDAEAYDGVLAAYRMPKTTDQEAEARTGAVEEALKNAALVPLQVAHDALEILELTEIVVNRGNPNAVTDGVVAAMMARTAVLGALYNVKINLGAIKDKDFVTDLTDRVEDLRSRAMEKEGAVLAAVDL